MSRRPAVPALLLGLALVVTGCGANFEAQTYQTRASADGTNTAVGAMALRNVRLLPPQDGGMYEAGEDAEGDLTLVNDGPEDDRLLSITTPGSRTVEMLADSRVVDSIEVPRLGTTGGTVGFRLVDLVEDLRPGRFVPMTFTFERNGEVVVQVPVETTGIYEGDRERSENFHEIGEHGEGGHSEGESLEGGEGGEETSGSGEGLPGAGEAQSTDTEGTDPE